MTGTPSVLALVPHFRCEEWLDHCLTSLVEQTRPPDGIVVIDDASEAPPVHIVRRFPGVTLLRAPANVGPYRLIQQVIDDTAFDWYMFQDADDWSARDRLEQLLAGAARTGAELIGSDYVMLSTGEGLTIPHAFPTDANAALKSSPTCHALQHPTSLVSGDLVKRLGGYASGLRFSGDDEFLRRAAHVTQVSNVSRFLYFRRHRPESLTTSAATGHGSPARRQLLDALGARAKENAAAVERGEAPRLEPYAQSEPIALEHLCGPFPIGSGRRSVRSMPAVKWIRSKLSPLGPQPDKPVLVVGGPVSGADALFWSLAQHPFLPAVLDVSWLASAAESFEKAGNAVVGRHETLSKVRELRPLDNVDASQDDVRRVLVSAVSQLLTGRSDQGSAWLALAPADPSLVGAVLRLFPDTRVIHVVRDADESAGTLAQRSKAVTRPMPLQDGYQSWLDVARGGIECERVAGPGRLLRVRFGDLVADPATEVDRCLRFVGAAIDPACARALSALDLVDTSPPDEATGGTGAADARDLSVALHGPPAIRSSIPAVHRRRRSDPGSAKPPVKAAAAPVVPAVSPTAELLSSLVPRGSVVAAVTKGDTSLDDIEGVDVWHFPRGADGKWAGYHPAATDDIVSHIGELRRLGARYLLIPPWTSWWLDHYSGLRDHLLDGGRLVSEGPELGSLFQLETVGTEEAPQPAPARSRSLRRPGRPRVSVVSWNTTHNPLGRAHVLAKLLAGRYDVEIVGARFDHFGSGTWAPLRDMDIPLRSFPGGEFPQFQRHLEDFARTITGDVIVVSKPRLPSYLLGIMAKSLRERPLILDVDDRELAFVRATGPRTLAELRARPNDELANPYGRWWTQLCESLVGSADQVTVSNETLRDLFGGTVVPHARDERIFDPERVDRAATRARFGFAPGERIVLFGGTPRRHKGVLELAEAVRQMGDPSVRLCLIGTPELDAMRDELAPYAGMMHVVPPQPFAAMPELVASADLVAILQDPAAEVSQHQMPAKVTDALAMRVPCLVNRVPPLESLVSRGHLEVVGEEGLVASLARILGDLEGAWERSSANRDVFLSEYSFSAVRPRLEASVDALLDRPQPLAAAHVEVLDFVKERFGPAPAPTMADVGEPSQPMPRPARRAAEGFDVVMFWKQHDTGLYGRRHDMLMQHLARSPRVGQVVQFDAPVDIGTLRRPADPDLPTHTDLLRERTLARVDGLEAAPGLHQYSFVYGGERGGEPWFHRRDEYPIHVKEMLRRHDLGRRPVVFWVYPKNFDFPEIAASYGPDLVVADVIDDHRTWLGAGDSNRERVMQNYAEIAAMSDLVLVNCEPMYELMDGMARSVHLVPNAAEYPDPAATADLDVPPELRDLDGPIVGYVGNLSSRIDVDLLDHLVTRRPDWNLVLVGSAHAGRSVARLTRHPNVMFLGPRPYESAKAYIRAFDVGIIPHLDDAMTRSMNPLKAFVYCALNVPVVATDIANLGDLRSLISVASDADDFVARVDRAVREGRRPMTAEADAVLRRNSWEARTHVVTNLIDEALDRASVSR